MFFLAVVLSPCLVLKLVRNGNYLNTLKSSQNKAFYLLLLFLVLPKFKVDVLTNSYAALGNGGIRGFVSAK